MGPRLSEFHHAVSTAAGAVHQYKPDHKEQYQNQQVWHKAEPEWHLIALGIIIGGENPILVLLPDQAAQVVIKDIEVIEVVGDGGLTLIGCAQLHDDCAVVNYKGFYLLVLE